MKRLINVTLNQVEVLKTFFCSYLIPLSDETVLLHIIKDNNKIMIHDNGELIITGPDTDLLYELIIKLIEDENYSSLGINMAGLNDIFGPLICVCTAIKDSDITKISSMIKLDDELSDYQIMQIAPYLMNQFNHTKVTLEPEKYHIMKNVKKLSKDKILCLFLMQTIKRNLDIYPNLPLILDEQIKEATLAKHITDHSYKANLFFNEEATRINYAAKVSMIIARFLFLNYLHNYSQQAKTHLIKGNLEHSKNQFNLLKNENIELLKKVAIF